MQSEMLLAAADALPLTGGDEARPDARILVGFGVPAELARFAARPDWTLYVPGHPDEVRRAVLTAMARGERAYVHVSAECNAEPHGATDGFEQVREGSAGVVLAVGAMLDPVLRATTGLDLAVLYTGIVRPFDEVGLRTAVLAADHADVVLVEPCPRGTSAHHIAGTLVHVPHRLLALGGPGALEETELARAVRDFMR
ncbi:transketolase [Streptomyces sp. NBC_00280]|uniref:transketolase n=1 Tax=Streptomyces sp. NBC_00280 TaxID=2975699 RepID=UPI00324F7794